MNPLVAPEQVVRPHRCALSVNVNKVAHLRNTRHLGIPSVARAATLCLQAGAQGITVHPRPDERHIRAADVHELHALLKQWPEAEYNIEGNPFQNLMGFIREVRPHQATFVPDSEDQFTSDHGWDVDRDAARLRPLIEECQALGVRVSLFMDPVPEAMAKVRGVGGGGTEPSASSSTPRRMRAPTARRARPRCWTSSRALPGPRSRSGWASTPATT
jgi:pyridoxine 5-phosphate synthase